MNNTTLTSRRYPNGGPGVLVAIDGTTTLDFAIETRQLFNKVTGAYTDYANGTTIIHTNVVSTYTIMPRCSIDRPALHFELTPV